MSEIPKLLSLERLAGENWSVRDAKLLKATDDGGAQRTRQRGPSPPQSNNIACRFAPKKRKGFSPLLAAVTR